MCPLESRNRTTADPEYCNLAYIQDKELKTAFMDMIDVLKREMNKQTVKGNE